MNTRGCGLLLHISSLPSDYGIGDFGPGARDFVDLLVRTKQQYWQLLPLTPIDPICGNSPYSSSSAFAGNIWYISPDILVEQGYINRNDCKKYPQFPVSSCYFSGVIEAKKPVLEKAYSSFKADASAKGHFADFCEQHAQWLNDYALYEVIKKHISSNAWNTWQPDLRDRKESALSKVRKTYTEDFGRQQFFQYLFYQQWFALKKYANEQGVQIVGDVPIYVRYDSADVWAHSDLFKLNADKSPTHVAGVPPDYFSETGQLWGNPVYNWPRIQETGYQWWFERFKHNFLLNDIVRIDHFRGFVACWEVPAHETTAMNGSWVEAPVYDFFARLFKRFSHCPVIAEDLGIITPDVREVLSSFGIAGMKILQFAFGEDDPKHAYLPHNYVQHCLVYTGTHDNNTTRGWFEHETDHLVRSRVQRYVQRSVSTDDIHWTMIQLALSSCANMVIIPVQDLLGLGGEARMNKPSYGEGNWGWRLVAHQMTAETEDRLQEMTVIYGRG